MFDLMVQQIEADLGRAQRVRGYELDGAAAVGLGQRHHHSTSFSQSPLMIDRSTN
jgi:hypothetical protein